MTAFTIASFILVTILGASIGSFGNVVVYRLPNKKNLSNPPSHCPNCTRRLTPLELIPILSWVALRAKCFGCKQKISARYPSVELLFALAFLTLALITQPDLTNGADVAGFTLQAATLSMLLMITLITWDTRTLPPSLTYGAAGASVLAIPFTTNNPTTLIITATLTATAMTALAIALNTRKRNAPTP